MYIKAQTNSCCLQWLAIYIKNPNEIHQHGVNDPKRPNLFECSNISYIQSFQKSKIFKGFKNLKYFKVSNFSNISKVSNISNISKG